MGSSRRPLDEAQRLVDSRYLSERLAISRQHALRLINQGTFGEVIDIGTKSGKRGVPRVSLDAVETWIESRTVAS